MNTPAHVVFNLLCVGRQDTTALIAPAVVGAILPDAPMFIMYFLAKVVWRQPESVIWSQTYYQAGWQNFTDLFNSIPLLLLGLGLCWWAKSPVGIVLFVSMLLHVAGDFPLHHHDAHRHFFPFSDWRYESPLSYWDPRYHGRIVSRVETVSMLVGCGILFYTYQSIVGKATVALVGLSYGAYFLYGLVVWRSL
ncbi:MAG: hypothetical protein AAGF66_16485 [Cyanobacteria bacterium P01_H01_bin.119]